MRTVSIPVLLFGAVGSLDSVSAQVIPGSKLGVNITAGYWTGTINGVVDE